MKINEIHKRIRENGGRISKERKLMLEIFSNFGCLISQEEIRLEFKKNGLEPNRSTIFRELQYLSKRRLLRKEIVGNKVYYELSDNHHHHLICLECKQIKKIDGCCLIEDREKKIAKQNSFEVIAHGISFFGRCKKCISSKEVK